MRDESINDFSLLKRVGAKQWIEIIILAQFFVK